MTPTTEAPIPHTCTLLYRVTSSVYRVTSSVPSVSLSRFHSVDPRRRGLSALQAKEGRAHPPLCNRLRGGANAVLDRRLKTISGRHHEQPAAGIAGHTTPARTSTQPHAQAQHSTGAAAQPPASTSRASTPRALTPPRHAPSQSISTLQRDAVELTARLASINLQARAGT